MPQFIERTTCEIVEFPETASRKDGACQPSLRHSLIDLENCLPWGEREHPVSNWLQSISLEETNCDGVATGRCGTVRNLDKKPAFYRGRVLPILFDDKKYHVAFSRLRIKRTAPVFSNSTTHLDLERAYQDGLFNEIIEYTARAGAHTDAWRVYEAASLAEIGEFEIALERATALDGISLPYPLSLQRTLTLMDLYRYLGHPAKALSIGQSVGFIDDASPLWKARYFIKESAARHAADNRDELALPTINRALSLLGEGDYVERAEALMHRARILRNQEQLPEACENLFSALRLMRGNAALHLTGRIFGNLTGVCLDLHLSEQAVGYASAAACCFRHSGCLNDLLKILGIIIAETSPIKFVHQRRYKQEIAQLSSQLKQTPYPKLMNVMQAMDSLGTKDLACVESVNHFGTRFLDGWSKDCGCETGIDERVLLWWSVCGAKLYRATIKRGEPAKINHLPFMFDAVSQRLEAVKSPGTDEHRQFGKIVEHLDNDAPLIWAECVDALLEEFRTQVRIPLDASGELLIRETIVEAIQVGFFMEHVFDFEPETIGRGVSS